MSFWNMMRKILPQWLQTLRKSKQRQRVKGIPRWVHFELITLYILKCLWKLLNTTVPISFGLPVQNIWALVPTSENLCYHWSAMINIHEQRLFANLEDIYFAYNTYTDWFTEDGTINFYFYPLCHYQAGTRPHLLQLLWIKPQPVLEFGKKSCSVVHLLFPLDLIWNIGKTLIKLRLHRL